MDNEQNNNGEKKSWRTKFDGAQRALDGIKQTLEHPPQRDNSNIFADLKLQISELNTFLHDLEPKLDVLDDAPRKLSDRFQRTSDGSKEILGNFGY